ncbi:hypothetical protein AC249_AIPGENE16451 [Exaiptasia diaphana]|nr:hypothetical protein AC249_AIPGENE16451 [Exaiptasia diaphana]
MKYLYFSISVDIFTSENNTFEVYLYSRSKKKVNAWAPCDFIARMRCCVARFLSHMVVQDGVGGKGMCFQLFNESVCG